MSYGLIYTIPFESSKGVAYVIEIEKEDYTGESTELEPDESPIIVTPNDDDFLYTPIRSSSATINVIGSDYLQQLYSTEYRQYRVTLLQGDKVCWCGFIKPELYTQEYADEVFTLSIECVGCFDVLENVDFSVEEKTSRTVWDLLVKMVEETRTRYNEILIPHVYALTEADYNAWNSPMKSLSVADQNWYDEDDESMTCKEVLEEIMKLFGWTATDWGGCMTIVDYDNMNGKYYRHNISDSRISESYEQKSVTVHVIQNIGYDGDNHTLDVMGGYNKVKIVCSNYNISELVPEMDFNNDTEIFEIPDDVVINISGLEKYTTHKMFLTSDKWELIPYDENGNLIEGDIDAYKGRTNELTGAFLAKVCGYSSKRPADGQPFVDEISEYSYDECIQLRKTNDEAYTSVFTGNEPVLRIKSSYAQYQDGIFCIDGELRPIFRKDMAYDPNGYDGPSHETQYIPCSVRIGDKYYNPTEGWTNEICIFNVYTELPDSYNNFTSIANRKTLSMPYPGANGYVVTIPDGGISGDLEFTIYGNKGDVLIQQPYGWYLKDLSFNFYKQNLNEKDDSEDDRTYENEVNKSYINEADDIELKLSTYNEDGACYSKLIKSSGGYLTDDLYCSHVAGNVRLEEMLIKRIVNQYKSSRFRLTQEVCITDIIPFDTITDESQDGKRFVYTGGEMDYQQDTMSIIMLEKE